MNKTPHVIALLAATVLSSDATVIFAENFGSTTVNPTTTSFTVQQTWSYSDNIDTAVNANASRLFNPGAVGSGETTHGWISSLATGNTFQQIQSNGSFTALPTLNLGEYYVVTLSWYGASQTSVTANDVNAYVNFTSSGNSLAFVTGANGAPGQAHIVSQTLSDSNAASDSLGLNFVAQGGAGGYDPGRIYTASFITFDDLNGDAFSLALGRTSNVGGAAFVIFDNVSIDVAVAPEPETALLGSLGILMLLRRRRV